ncbi:integrase core domain-containing protein [Candidatus Palauibacter sp.]|uniref:integrase core domain-containing protein n=1 Tax=Candidatus Palauibacter sp. TaxID=3101350 RepID=UPI003CC658F5
MTAKCTAQLLADLGVTQSLGRPRVSNDNPYSEAQFKTVKYHPGFPGRFAGVEEAKDFCRAFFQWYNTEHRHGGIGLLTPEQVQLGRAPAVIRQRHDVLAAAHAARPERFVAGPPRAAELPAEVWINRALPVTAVDGAEPAGGEDHGKEGSLN